MLKDFFKLNTPFTVFKAPADLVRAFNTSNDLRNVLYQPNTLTFRDINFNREFFVKTTFTNVSFTRTEVRGIIFRDCKFEDCLFIGTRFVDCEFHACTFINCNPHKVEFINTYIDPAVFEGMLDKVKHWNIGIHLFQALYRNAADTQQSKFLRTAEFNVNKWQRYVLEYRHPGWRKFKDGQGTEWVVNFLSYILVGYGIRGKFLMSWGIIVALASVIFNYIFWDALNVSRSDGSVSERGIIEVLYYTGTILGGFGDLSPGSDLGKLALLVQLGFGLFLVSLFVRWLIRLALR